MSLSRRFCIGLALLNVVIFVLAYLYFGISLFTTIIALLMMDLTAIGISLVWDDCSSNFIELPINIPGLSGQKVKLPYNIVIPIVVFRICINIVIDNSLYFGYVADASPISSENSQHFSGYCGKLKDYLESKNYKFDKAEIKYSERFQRKAHNLGDTPNKLIPKDNLIIECSANTITEERKREIYENGGGHFSEPFAKTGAKLLIRDEKELRESLNPQGLNLPLQGEKIGILGKTTTISLIKSIYTKSEFKPYTNRGDVINDLNRDELKIYPSDSILLKYMLESSESGLENPEQYVIWPDHFLSHENYGIVVYGVYKDYKYNKYDSAYRELQDQNQQFDGDYADLLDTINKWIVSQSGQEAYNEYIEKYAP